MKISKKRGFTLVELLVVIVIIAVLVGLSATAVLRFRRTADKTIAISNIRQVHTANVSYASDHSSRFVSPVETIDNKSYDWWKNPEFVSQLKSSQSTYVANGEPNVDLPLSLMDPVVVKERKAGYKELAGSFAYNTEGMPADANGVKRGFGLPLVGDPGRTFAFITSGFSSNGVLNHASAGNIAYRHEEKAIAVFYDGHASPVTETDVNDATGGATGAFWDANPDDN